MQLLKRLPRYVAALAVLASSLTAAAVAGTFQIDPVAVTLSTVSNNVSDVTITNTGKDTLQFSAEAYDWTQTSNNELNLRESDDLVVFPGTFSIAPNSSRRIRVGLKNAAGSPPEGAYRLYIEQMPPAHTKQSSIVNVVTRVGIPVFFQNAKTLTAMPKIAQVTIGHGGLDLVVRNLGNGHLAPSTLVAVFEGADGKAIAKARQPVWYLLAGAERQVRVAVPADACREAKTMSLTWRVDGAQTITTQAVPIDGCR